MNTVRSDTPVAVVTGGSRGIGAAVARRLAADGQHVYLTCRTGTTKAKAVVEDILAAGGRAEAVEADVSREEAVRELFARVRREQGRLDVLVNNAGISEDGFLLMMSDRKWSNVIDTNLTGAFRCCRDGTKLMAAARSGSVINIASVAGIVGTAGQGNYAAAKGGLIALTKSLAAEVAKSGIRVNAVVPGFIDSDMLRTIPAALLAEQLRQVPMGRVGTAAEVAAAVSWLASGESSYVTGSTLVIDGGLVRQ